MITRFIASLTNWLYKKANEEEVAFKIAALEDLKEVLNNGFTKTMCSGLTLVMVNDRELTSHGLNELRIELWMDRDLIEMEKLHYEFTPEVLWNSVHPWYNIDNLEARLKNIDRTITRLKTPLNEKLD